MAAKELYDYLSEATPDAAFTLSVNPSGLNEIITKNQEFLPGDGIGEEVLGHLDDPIIYVELSWRVKSKSDAGTVFDFWIDTAKGNGYANSFIWNHPTDGHQYVVRFASQISRVHVTTSFMTFNTFTLRVIGYYAP